MPQILDGPSGAAWVRKPKDFSQKIHPACIPMENHSAPVRSRAQASRPPASAKVIRPGTMSLSMVKPCSICPSTTNPLKGPTTVGDGGF